VAAGRVVVDRRLGSCGFGPARRPQVPSDDPDRFVTPT
jgi:hypothetical protein